jgi:hypothetical protein
MYLDMNMHVDMNTYLNVNLYMALTHTCWNTYSTCRKMQSTCDDYVGT